jgi:alpha-L-fucosidase
MKYQEDWNSLATHGIPEWLRDAKFGIYTHWGVHSVPAKGPNGTWHPNLMYIPGGSLKPDLEDMTSTEYHEKNYGKLEEFGYKDYIPMFTAEHFDADEWAEVFKGAGAKFAGPVAEHHDGFTMWDSKVNKWNAVNMGPKRDIVREITDAVRKRGMKTVAAMHHAEQWFFYNHNTKYDTADPAFEGLYGKAHNVDEDPSNNLFINWHRQDFPDRDFHEQWLNKLYEVVDNYEPDLMFFDVGMVWIQEEYRKRYLSYYYNKENEWNKKVVASYKFGELVAGSAIVDLEQSRMNRLMAAPWLTDTTIDDGMGWCYINGCGYRSPKELLHYLIDTVSKNGQMLLSVNPLPNGKIEDEAKAVLKEMGKWLERNGESIYGTRPWTIYGEGPDIKTAYGSAAASVEYGQKEYTNKDFRFTAKGTCLYAICMGKPDNKVHLKVADNSFGRVLIYENEIASIRILGTDKNLNFRHTKEGVFIDVDVKLENDYAYVFKIERQSPFC